MSKQNAHVKTIKDLAAQGKNTKYIRAYLTLEGVNDKDATAIIAEAGLVGHRAGFTQTDTLAALEEGLTEKALYELILNEEAKNEARWINDRNRIRKTINAVYEKMGQPVIEEAASSKLKDQVKKLWK